MRQPSLDEVQATLTAPGAPFEMDEVGHPGRGDARLEARPAEPPGGARSQPGPRRPGVPGVRGRAPDLRRALPRRPATWPRSCATASASSRATASPSPCGTSPSGRWPSGRRPRRAPSSCRSTRGGPGPSSSTASTDSGSSRALRRPRPGSSGSPTTSRASPALRAVIVARAEAGAALAGRRAAFDDVLGDVPADAALPAVDHRPRRRRDDLLHVGHDRAARRARSAPTATSAPT